MIKGNFREFFTLLFASSDRIYLQISYFLKFSFTSIAICCRRNFWDNLNHLPRIGCQTLVGRGKFPLIASFLALPIKVWRPPVVKRCNGFQKFLHQLMPTDVHYNLKKFHKPEHIHLKITSNLVKISQKWLGSNIAI